MSVLAVKSLKYLLRSKWRLFLVFSALFLFYNEELIHFLQARNWQRTTCNGNCTRILLVADPQLIGETFDENLYNGVAIYDSDNFLRKTFNRALDHVQPDIILFLGDIFDEGSVASPEAFQRYWERFHRIFRFNAKIKAIIIPGDNDIGGENGEIVTPRNVLRFKEAFGTRPFYKIGDTMIYTLNRMSHEIPEAAPQHLLDTGPPVARTIVISHLSLLFQQSQYAERVLNLLQPTVIFSGHLHRSLSIKRNRHEYHTKANPLNVHDHDKYDMHEFDVTETVNSERSFLEILVPTCSYRMGEKNVGYGMATIDKDHLYYTVLWSVERFYILYAYLVVLSLWAIAGLFFGSLVLAKKYFLRRNIYDYHKV